MTGLKAEFTVKQIHTTGFPLRLDQHQRVLPGMLYVNVNVRRRVAVATHFPFSGFLHQQRQQGSLHFTRHVGR